MVKIVEVEMRTPQSAYFRLSQLDNNRSTEFTSLPV
jgi:hypothetical protein